MKPRNAVLAGALFAGLSAVAACAEIHDVQGQATAYNEAVDDANNQVLLLNMLRTVHDRPAEWTSIRQVVGNVGVSGGLGLLTPLGPRGANTFGFEVNPTALWSGSSQSSIDALDIREFYQHYVNQLEQSEFGVYSNPELDAIVYHLFFNEIRISAGDQRFSAEGDPGSAFYRETMRDPTLPPGPDAFNTAADDAKPRQGFRKTYKNYLKLVEAFFDARLVSERYVEETDIGPPLTGRQVQQQLRAIAAATTSTDEKARLSLEKDKKTRQYQLKKEKDKETDRYCLRGEPWNGKTLSPGPPGNALAGKESKGRDELDLLVAAARALRCGATKDERKSWDDKKDEYNKKYASKESKETKVSEKLETSRAGSDVDLVDVNCEKNSIQYEISVNEFLQPYCNFVEDIKKIADLPPYSYPRLISIKIVTRSLSDVLSYLGAVAAWYYENHTPIMVPEYGEESPNIKGLFNSENKSVKNHGDIAYCGLGWTGHHPKEDEQRYACLPLLVVNKNGANGPEFVSVGYDDDAGRRDTYWVPRTDAGHSAQVFEIVHQLLSLAKVAKDLPAASIITVAPSP